MKHSCPGIYLAAFGSSLICFLNVHGQLAITEVMSSASETQFITNTVLQRPDFWELTNFGTNVVDLGKYRFNDDGGFAGAQDELFQGMSIFPGETVIFVREGPGICTNAVQFRSWWGDNKLPQNLQIHFYQRPGFSGERDAVQLWHVTDQETNLVDRVELYSAVQGRSFTTDPDSGLLQSVSAISDFQTFKAEETDDVGSPGFTNDAVPLAIIEHPESVDVDAGSSVEFRVRASGLPRPRFQWLHAGSPIVGATGPTHKINAALIDDEGSYTVEVSNGVASISSQAATLEVNARTNPPSIIIAPRDIDVMPGQTAVFELKVRGYPLPTFQWRFKNEDITDATNATLTIPNVGLDSVGLYSVRIWNAYGSTNASAKLEVWTPNLVITEMMGARSTNTVVFGRGDWWELTNMGDRAVNLRGYKFDDFPRVIEGAFVITNEVIIRPGESVVFLQEMTPELFKYWWGEENLPTDLQFVRYHGNGIDGEGDSLSIWNPYAVNESDYIWLAEYVNAIMVDGQLLPNRGFSLTFWVDAGFIEEGQVSVPEILGAFKAANSEDIGSPGYIGDRPPRALGIQRDSQGTHLRWRTTTGSRYELLKRENIPESNWEVIGEFSAVAPELTISYPEPGGTQKAFYMLRQVMAAP